MVDLPVGMTPWKFASEDKYMEKAYLWGQHNGNLLVMMTLWRRQLTCGDNIMEVYL